MFTVHSRSLELLSDLRLMFIRPTLEYGTAREIWRSGGETEVINLPSQMSVPLILSRSERMQVPHRMQD